ncbi:MAG TPA: hypothetical protein VGW38_13115 [Chloroflexota bacterium]|nr:hypothetical protein [Chloroflexota bacterium]
MTIIFPLAILALVSLAVAVWAGVKGASPHTEASQRSVLRLVAVFLTIVALVAGSMSWWSWRFIEEWDF